MQQSKDPHSRLSGELKGQAAEMLIKLENVETIFSGTRVDSHVKDLVAIARDGQEFLFRSLGKDWMTENVAPGSLHGIARDCIFACQAFAGLLTFSMQSPELIVGFGLVAHGTAPDPKTETFLDHVISPVLTLTKSSLEKLTSFQGG